MPYIYGQLLNAQLENSVGDPASGGTPLGRIYIDITNSANAIAKYWNGTAYVPFGSSIATANSSSVVNFNNNGNSETVYNTNGATIASLTLNFPTTTKVGQILRYTTAGAITAVTYVGTIAIGPTPTSIPSPGSVVFQAINTTGTFVGIL